MNLWPSCSAALVSLCLFACATPGPLASATTGAPEARPNLTAICRAERVDATSMIFPARDPSGKITRYSVTPSRRIADMGNLIFDAGGTLLGHGTGGEFPWDKPGARAAEEARVAALFAGAAVAKGEAPLRCP